MTIEDVRHAAIDAVRHSGPADKAPLEVAQVTRDGTGTVYSAVFNDLRASSSSGSVVSIDVDTSNIYTNVPAIRYVLNPAHHGISGFGYPVAKPERISHTSPKKQITASSVAGTTVSNYQLPWRCTATTPHTAAANNAQPRRTGDSRKNGKTAVRGRGHTGRGCIPRHRNP